MTNRELQELYTVQSYLAESMPEIETPERKALDLIDSMIDRAENKGEQNETD